MPRLFSSLHHHLFPRLVPEIVVVVNGSTDGTCAVAREYQCRVVVSDDPLHPGAARNLGMEVATGELLVFLDADVRVTGDWARRLSWIAGRTDGSDRLLSGYRYFVPEHPGFVERHWHEPLSRLEPRYVNGGNLLATRTAMRILSGFDPTLVSSEDVDLCARARANDISVVLDKELRTIHDGFPRTLTDVVRRERWHGAGDASSTRRLLNSRATCLATVFLGLHLMVLLGLALHWVLTLVGIAGIAGLCTGITWFRLRSQFVPSPVMTNVVFYCYLVGRSLAFIDGVLGAAGGRSSVRSQPAVQPPTP